MNTSKLILIGNRSEGRKRRRGGRKWGKIKIVGT
jgi:hypothetical protein